MCEKTVLVPIPEFLISDYDDIWRDGEYGERREFDIDPQGRKCFALDECIVPAVELLWAAGIRTTGCCCGHGSGHGVVSIEVPNGNDVERRDKQIQYFYREIAKPGHSHERDMPHEFRGSKFTENAQV